MPALILLAALSAQAAAQETDPHRPTAEERAWLARCLANTDPDDIVAGARCAGLITRACLGHDEPEVPRLAQPPGRGGHPRSCAPIETALWEELAERGYREAAAALKPAAREALGRGQGAWIRFRDATCEVEALIHPGFLGRDLAAECRRDVVTARALDLRRLSAQAREARDEAKAADPRP